MWSYCDFKVRKVFIIGNFFWNVNFKYLQNDHIEFSVIKLKVKLNKIFMYASVFRLLANFIMVLYWAKY